MLKGKLVFLFCSSENFSHLRIFMRNWKRDGIRDGDGKGLIFSTNKKIEITNHKDNGYERIWNALKLFRQVRIRCSY